MAIANYDYSKQLANLRNAQQKAQQLDLKATRDQALSNLAAEQQQNTANYATQRSTANAQNRLAARNFQEYLANTGRANSGLGAQAAMQYNNNLNTSLNNIYGAENAANADIMRRRTDASNAYNTGLAKANADIQANYIQALLDERAKRWDREMQIAQQKQAEKEFKESIRQFNKNYDLQKRNFSSGSGGGRAYGGSRRSYSGSGIDSDPLTDGTPKSINIVYDLINNYGKTKKDGASLAARLATNSLFAPVTKKLTSKITPNKLLNYANKQASKPKVKAEAKITKNKVKAEAKIKKNKPTKWKVTANTKK